LKELDQPKIASDHCWNKIKRNDSALQVGTALTENVISRFIPVGDNEK